MFVTVAVERKSTCRVNFSLLQQLQPPPPPLLPLDSCGKSTIDRRSSFETRTYWRFKEVVRIRCKRRTKTSYPRLSSSTKKRDCIDTPHASSFFPRPDFTHPRHPKTPSSCQPSSLLESFLGIHSRIHQRPPFRRSRDRSAVPDW